VRLSLNLLPEHNFDQIGRSSKNQNVAADWLKVRAA